MERGPCPAPSEATGILTLTATTSAAAALRADGAVVTWGANTNSQLGHPVPATTCTSLETADRPSVREVPGLTGVTALDGGGTHLLALKADATVVAWGRNIEGQLGIGSTTETGTPTSVTGLTNVTHISAGGNHSLAVRSDGTVWAWGGNNYRQLGVTGANRTTPVQVMGVMSPVAVAAGWNSSFAVLSNGTVWTWGSIPTGLIPGAPSFTATPTQIPSLVGISTLVAGQTAVYALAQDGRVWAWGANTYGQLGDDTTTSRNTPGVVPNLPAIRSIATGTHHAVAVAKDGSVWAWGYNAQGQVGDDFESSNRLAPMLVSGAETQEPADIPTPGTYDPSSDVVRYYHADAIGSVRVITDPNGSVTERMDYEPFGVEWAAPSSEKRRFTGQERDTNTGLDYFGGRYYDQGSSRFTSTDPVLNADAALLDPQRWNRYSYAGNQPLGRIDPDGRDWYDFAKGFAGGIVDTFTSPFTLAASLISDPESVASAFGDNLRLLARGLTHPSEVVDQIGRMVQGDSSDHRELGRISGAIVTSAAVGGSVRAVAGRLGRSETALITFGRNNNQIHHAFRHVDAAGLSRSAVEGAVASHLTKIHHSLDVGQLVKFSLRVQGREITYNAFRLKDGTINVGRITVE